MFTTRPELVGTYGMVASTHWLASSAGMAVLESGGNAFDAAVAAGLTLQVVEPHLNGPGGEVPILLHSAEGGRTLVVAGQGPAPAAVSIDHFERLGLDLVPGTGLLAACVPGAFDAWMLMLGEFGTLRLSEVMRYAIDYAGGGYPLVPQISATISGVEGLFRDEWPSSARVYLRGSGVPRPGTLFSNPDLAATYRRILEEAEATTSNRDGQIEAARDVFYRGFVAEAIDRYASSETVMDTSGRRHTGLLKGDDLAAYAADLEEPATLDYHGYTVCKTGPWGQGPVFLQQLALLEGFDLTSMGHNTAEYVHTVVECAKLAFADREAHYGDPRFVDALHEPLLHPSYTASRRMLVGEDASYDLRPGTAGGRAPRLPDRSGISQDGAAGAGEPTVPRDDQGSGDTCHRDVVDRHGNMVSATPSGGWLQSSPVVPGLGFPLGTRAQMFWLTAGLPNSLEGGKRPRTTLTPSLALRDGEPYLAFGTPGGDQQDQWSLHFFLAHAHFGLNLQEAIDAPNFHTEHFPSSFYPRAAAPGRIMVEDRIGPDVVAGLRARDHDVDVVDGWSLGRISAVSRDARDGSMRGAANPRGMQGYAVGR
ncbi:MAG TPA: gamma-glutamyltransferase family protein [Rubrobacter sp.]|nr:gamma-glutamyltransferase family protein [Rubrobacter sp.]